MANKIRQTAAGKPNSLSPHTTRGTHEARQVHQAHQTHQAGKANTASTTNKANKPRELRRRASGARALARSTSARPELSKRGGRAASGVNKSAFVRSLPGSLSAAEVIEKGKAKGIKLSAAQVYTIRANARRKGPDVSSAGLLRGAGVEGTAARPARGRGGEAKEAEFIAAALDLGLARAEALIRALRAKASSGWS